MILAFVGLNETLKQEKISLGLNEIKIITKFCIQS